MKAVSDKIRNLGSVAQSIEARLALTNGTYTVKTDREKLVPFYLLSDALLDGNFHLTLGGEPGAFKVWSGDSTNSTLLAVSGQTITNGNPHFFAAMDAETQVWLEVLKPGPCEIAYGFTGEGSAEGINFTDTINITAQWELKVQLMAENDYITGIGTGDAVNTNITWNGFDLNAIMQNVADFYETQFGIDLIWTNTPFTMPATNYNGVVTNFYRHTGTVEYNPSDAFPNGQTIMGASVWIYRDLKLRIDNLQIYWDTYGRVNADEFLFIRHNRNDDLYGDFVKLALPSRIGWREEDGRYVMNPRTNAKSNFAGKIVENQGAYANAVNLSEEYYLKTGSHMPKATFIALLEYCIAHEIFHLIGGRHDENPPPNPDGTPTLSQGFHPLSEIRVSDDERAQVDLPNRASIKRD